MSEVWPPGRVPGADLPASCQPRAPACSPAPRTWVLPAPGAPSRLRACAAAPASLEPSSSPCAWRKPPLPLRPPGEPSALFTSLRCFLQPRARSRRFFMTPPPQPPSPARYGPGPSLDSCLSQGHGAWPAMAARGPGHTSVVTEMLIPISGATGCDVVAGMFLHRMKALPRCRPHPVVG